MMTNRLNTMGWKRVWVTTGLCLVMLSCQSTPAPPQPGDPLAPSLLEGYSLLFELVSKQRQVDGIFLLKSASKTTTDVVVSIAKLSQQAADQIQAFADQEAQLTLDRESLPTVERSARGAIESATTKELLFADEGFELRLLLTQVEATRYGASLAQALMEIEKNTPRHQWLKQFKDRYARAHTDVYERIESLIALPKPGS